MQFLQCRTKLIHFFSGAAIDNPAAAGIEIQSSTQCNQLLSGLFNFKIKIRPIKAADITERIPQCKKLRNVRTHASGCGCRTRTDDGPLRQRAAKRRDFQIVRTKIMSPLRDTMRLVHNKHTDSHLRYDPLERRHTQSLRRNINDFICALHRTFFHIIDLFFGKRTVDISRLNTVLHKHMHLILHQRDQRRYNQRHSVHHQRGQLKANGFSGPCRHHGQRIPSV